MVHCPLSRCHLLRDIISQGKKTIMVTYNQSTDWGTLIFFLFHCEYLFCVFSNIDFFPTFFSVRLPLSSSRCFLAECGVVAFHTWSPSYKAERYRHMYIHFLCAQLLLEINNSFFFPLWNVKANFKIRIHSLNGKILNIPMKFKNLYGLVNFIVNYPIQKWYERAVSMFTSSFSVFSGLLPNSWQEPSLLFFFSNPGICKSPGCSVLKPAYVAQQ